MRYDQLKAAYEQAKNAELAYWAELQRLVRRVRTDFAVYLGVSEDNWIPVGSSTLPTISIGITNEKGEFEARTEAQLPKNGRSIEFSLRLVFGGSLNSEPNPLVVFPLSITEAGGGFPITVKSDPDEPEFNGPIHTQLFDDLFKRAMDSVTK